MHLASQIESRRDAVEKSMQNEALCNLGTDLMDGGPFYWAFLPPNNIELGKIFQRLLESGIYDLMMRERIGLSHSARVQDRSRVKSKKHIQTDSHRHSEGGTDRLNDKLAKVFFLWLLCIGMCIVLIGLEIFYWNVTNKYQNLYKSRNII